MKIYPIPLFLCFLLLAQIVRADLESGIAAYTNGDYEIARKEFETATKNQIPEGMHLLASLYYEGHGVEKDIAIAVKGFKAAAAKGHTPAMYNLGLMFQKGEEVEGNIEQAISYYTAAGSKEHLNATFNLGQIFRKGDGLDADNTRAIAYYKFAAERGHIPSLNEYGLMLVQGLDIEKNLAESYAWISLAVYSGDTQAVKNFGQLKSLLGRDELKEAKKRKAAAIDQLADRGVYKTSLEFAIGQPGGQSIFIRESCLPPFQRFRSIHREYKTGDEFGTYRKYRIDKYLDVSSKRPLPIVVITDLLTKKQVEIPYRDSGQFPSE